MTLTESLSTWMRSMGRRCLETAAVATWGVANVFVFGAYDTYRRNPDMFRAPFSYLVEHYYLDPAVRLWLPVVAVGALVPSFAFDIFLVLLFALALIAWGQGNFLVWSYGAFDGNPIAFATHTDKGVAELALWLIASAALLHWRTRLRPKLWVAAGGLCLLQAIALGSHLHGMTPRDQNLAPTTTGPKHAPVPVRSRPDSIFELSDASNVILYISDGMQSDIFAELIASDPKLAEIFDGFTYFDDASTNSSSTVGAYPAMLTGIPYDGSVGFRDYTDHTIQKDNLGLALYRKGYSVAHVLQSPNLYFQPEHSVSPFVFTKQFEANDVASRTLLDATLFRHVPHFVKPHVFDGRTGVATKILGMPATFVNETVAYVDFVRLATLRLNVRHDGVPAFRLFHLLNAHPPISLNESCTFESMGRARRDYLRTNICSLVLFRELVTRLKELGVYDNSIIVFLGDHGARGDRTGLLGVTHGLGVGDAWPAVLLKPMHQRGPMRASHAQAEIADIAATIAAMTGLEPTFPGRPLLSLMEEESRERHFFLGKPGERWDKSTYDTPHGTYFAIRGKVRDPESWSVLRSNMES